MRICSAGWVLILVVVFASPRILRAQSPAQTGRASKPDLSGVWVWSGKGEGARNRFSMKEPPLLPQAMEIYKANRKGLRDADAPGLEKLDPFTYCFPSGVPRNMLGSKYPFEIVQNPKQNSNRVLILDETNNTVRQIWMDGRAHPEGWPFGWMGHSIGKWDGDTLVVDTVGRNDRTWLDFAGTPHSSALHIVERMRRLDHDTLEIEFMFEDPKTFTMPWGAKRRYQLKPGLQIAERIPCKEHLKLGN